MTLDSGDTGTSPPAGLPVRLFWLALSFAMAGLAEGFIAPLAADLRRSALLVLMVLGALAALGPRLAIGARRVLPGALVAAVGFLAARFGADSVAQLGGAAVFCVGLAVAHRDERTQRSFLLEIAAALALFGLSTAVRLETPVWVAYEAWASLSCSAVRIARRVVDLGPSALGLEAATYCVFLVAAGAVRARGGRVRLGIGLAGIVVAPIVYALAFALVAERIRPFTNEGFEEGPIWFRGLWALWAALIGLATLATGRPRRAPAPARRAALALGALALGAIAIAAASSVLAVRETAVEPPISRVILLVSNEKPDAEPAPKLPGYYEGESYGLFRRLLTDCGFTVRSSSSSGWGSADLSGVSLVVFLYPSVPEVSGQKRLRDFVSAGGSLLLLHDHTPAPDALAQLDALLAPASLKYRFDSAFLHGLPLGPACRIGSATLARGLRRAAEDDFGVGASMGVSGSARVLLEARWGVGDRGFEGGSAALLGNRHYENGDRLANLAVVAGASLGRGRIVVAGDPSSLLDSAVPFSYEFALALIDEATDPRSLDPNWVRLLAATAAALMIVALAGGAYGGLAVLAVGVAMAVGRGGDFGPRTPPIAKWDRVVAIDDSLRSRSYALSRDPARSIKGFAHQCFVNGYLPVFSRDLDGVLLARPEHLVLIAPARPPSESQTRAIVDFVEGGGNFWAACGYEEADGCSELLARWGLAVLSRPLGSYRNQPRFRQGPMDRSPEGVGYEEAWEVSSERPEGVTRLASAYGFPYCIRVARSRGTVTLIGDSYFLCDRNLEDGKSGDPANIAFVGDLLDRGRRSEGRRAPR